MWSSLNICGNDTRAFYFWIYYYFSHRYQLVLYARWFPFWLECTHSAEMIAENCLQQLWSSNTKSRAPEHAPASDTSSANAWLLQDITANNSRKEGYAILIWAINIMCIMGNCYDRCLCRPKCNCEVKKSKVLLTIHKRESRLSCQ